MKHCLLMTAYKDSRLINKFISTIPRCWGIYIHLDKKSNIEASEIDSRAKVYKVNNINWGGVEHLDSILMLMDIAHKDTTYDYYHIVTGQDFLASHPKDFDKILGNNKMNYMGYFSLPRKDWWKGGYYILQYKTLASRMDVRKLSGRILNKSYYLIQKIFHLQRTLPNYPLFGGSVYGSFTNEAIEFFLYSELAKDLRSRLNNTTCSEEIFFQTLLLNSPLKNKIVNNHLRYMDWNTPKGPRPKVLLLEDFEKFYGKELLFCRKVDYNKSKDLIDKIYQQILNK